jgi:hypothetical protein
VADGDREAAPRVAIVSTSVNATPSAYAEWAQQGDLIVAGDRNSPLILADYVKDLGGEYLTPGEQEFWAFSDSVGWNTIQRRNAAVMVAYARQYDYVVTTDDDNHPTEDWVKRHVGHLQGKLPSDTVVVHGDRDWIDPGMFVNPTHHWRGTPYGVVRYHTVLGLTPQYKDSVVVSTAQVLGDPDCDAVTRLVNSPRVESVQYNAIADRDSWMAFNSQATVWDGRWSPLIACIPHVGRYDDIIASFVAKRVMMAHEKTVYVGSPAVVQSRNEHDLIGDLRNEYYGMQATPYVVDALRRTPVGYYGDVVDGYSACVDALEHNNALNPDALKFMHQWASTWRTYQW